jgi:EAL domain-containing protein (putative c-di-GMP-specific phosphodiesterase class I)
MAVASNRAAAPLEVRLRGPGQGAGAVLHVRALAMLARDVGATLVVEGVERQSDLAHLARTGLPLLVQGYAIARPGPPWPTTSRSAERSIRDAGGNT